MPPTIRPGRARFVWAARKPSVVQPSSIGSSVLPTLRIWKKWSITQIESKPTSSAWRAIWDSVGAMAGVPPGHVNELICRPIFIVAERTSRSSAARRRAGQGALTALLTQFIVRRDERSACPSGPPRTAAAARLRPEAPGRPLLRAGPSGRVRPGVFDPRPARAARSGPGRPGRAGRGPRAPALRDHRRGDARARTL